MYQVKIAQFDGPYDLLLKLIEKKNLDVSEITLSNVTEQFLSYIDESETINSGELADFLVVASKLLYIKSKLLLPEIVEEEDIDDLEKHLKLYKSFIDAAQGMQEQLNKGLIAFPKDKIPVIIEKKFRAPEGITQNLLHETFCVVLSRLKPVVKLPQALIEKTVSLHERISYIRGLLANKKRLGFKAILAKSENRSDVIISFLALLELVNKRKVAIEQPKNFEDIIIVNVGQTL